MIVFKLLMEHETKIKTELNEKAKTNYTIFFRTKCKQMMISNPR